MRIDGFRRTGPAVVALVGPVRMAGNDDIDCGIDHVEYRNDGARKPGTGSVVESMLDHLLHRQQRYAASDRNAVIRRCMDRIDPVPIATHDDTTVEHVEDCVSDGVSISEFPTTLTAARAARERGLGIIMGAPNVVRGGSHSGNVSAAELAQHDLLDVLSSDYVPASLLHAAFMLQREGFSLPRAVATVSRNPAFQ